MENSVGHKGICCSENLEFGQDHWCSVKLAVATLNFVGKMEVNEDPQDVEHKHWLMCI